MEETRAEKWFVSMELLSSWFLVTSYSTSRISSLKEKDGGGTLAKKLLRKQLRRPFFFKLVLSMLDRSQISAAESLSTRRRRPSNAERQARLLASSDSFSESRKIRTKGEVEKWKFWSRRKGVAGIEKRTGVLRKFLSREKSNHSRRPDPTFPRLRVGRSTNAGCASGFFARLKTVYHPRPFTSLSLKFILRCFSYLSVLGGGDWRGCCFCAGGLHADCTFDCVETWPK